MHTDIEGRQLRRTITRMMHRQGTRRPQANRGESRLPVLMEACQTKTIDAVKRQRGEGCRGRPCRPQTITAVTTMHINGLQGRLSFWEIKVPTATERRDRQSQIPTRLLYLPPWSRVHAQDQHLPTTIPNGGQADDLAHKRTNRRTSWRIGGRLPAEKLADQLNNWDGTSWQTGRELINWQSDALVKDLLNWLTTNWRTSWRTGGRANKLVDEQVNGHGLAVTGGG